MPGLEASSPISFHEALEHVRKHARRRVLPVLTCDLAHALGTVLAGDFHANRNQPPFTNAAMDGIALRGADLHDGGCRLRLIGTVLAGTRSLPRVESGTCARITTGAPMPPGTDTVVIKEVVRSVGDFVEVPGGQRAGANVRMAGEDMRRGELILRAGSRLHPPHLAVLASFGQAQVQVRRGPRVAVVATGDELLAPGAPRAAGRIHDSNGPMLAAQAQSAGAEVTLRGRIADDRDKLLAALAEAAARSDLVVTAGGVSMGEADFLPDLLHAHGRVHFWRVRMKPGLPILFGELNGTLVFGLPGNPVSAAAGFQLMVREALAILQGAQPPSPARARLRSAVRKRHDRTEFVRGTLGTDDDGVLWLQPHRKQGSAQLGGLLESNALACIPETMHDPEAGTVLEVWPLTGQWP